MGDGISISFIPAGFNTTTSPNGTFLRLLFILLTFATGDANFTLQGAMQACVQLRQDIPHSASSFPIPDFALARFGFITSVISPFLSFLYYFYSPPRSPDYKMWTPLQTSVNQTSGSYCLLLTQPGM
jgi:hypothetical protein